MDCMEWEVNRTILKLWQCLHTIPKSLFIQKSRENANFHEKKTILNHTKINKSNTKTLMVTSPHTHYNLTFITYLSAWPEKLALDANLHDKTHFKHISVADFLLDMNNMTNKSQHAFISRCFEFCALWLCVFPVLDKHRK